MNKIIFWGPLASGKTVASNLLRSMTDEKSVKYAVDLDSLKEVLADRQMKGPGADLMRMISGQKSLVIVRDVYSPELLNNTITFIDGYTAALPECIRPKFVIETQDDPGVLPPDWTKVKCNYSIETNEPD